MEKLLNMLGYYKRKKKKEYKPIRYIQSDEPIDIGEKLKKLMIEGNKWAREREKEDYELVGMFFTIVLLIEHKLVNLLKVIDDDIENKMLGAKIDVFKDFLKIYTPEEDEDIEEYRKLIQPLNEIKKVRNSLAHDVTKPRFEYRELTQTDSYVKKRRPDMYDKFKDCEDDRGKCLGLLATFGFVLSFEIAKLRVGIEH
ncbi:hypothetical protein [Salinivibrio sp. ML323]|uniref:hypothetical protein n=1 Tax=Salinivibrio sp. ML323 TaxID=1909474 RepID=UPI0018E9A9B9|nr:hypothetical protein [Salinivibrio sp. ML323]